MKKSMKKTLFILFLFVIQLSSFAQPTTDEQLALQFYQNREFDKALDYYEKLYNKKSPQEFYTPYLNCLLELKEFKKAEKIVKKQIKQEPLDLTYNVDLGIVFMRADEPSKAKEEWEKAVKLIKQDNQVFTLANAFIAIKEYDYAIDTYLKGRKISQTNYPYSFELADVYKAKGDKLKMINEYLDALELSDSYIQTVQNALQTSFGSDVDKEQNDLVKGELLKRIQKSPDKTIYSELLIWMQLQLKDYEGAFVQAKALDKRKKEEGARVMGLAGLFAQNQQYDLASRAYQFVIDKGKDNYYYINARMEQLNVSYNKIVSSGVYNSAYLVELEKNYNTAIIDLGKSSETAPLLKNYAHLLAFYLHKTEDAINLLEEVILFPSLSDNMQAECKLELGDILLMSGDVWEASLRYSQVEKAFKYDVIGQEAKYRVAKISYYTGDFKWAQAQLDVLKGATSKLISNDAMYLSLLISDAMAVDTNVAPLLIFARADLLSFQNKDSIAMITLDSINTLFPNHDLADDILYKKAQIELKHGKFEQVAKYYETIMNDYGDRILGDDAMFKLAELNEINFKNTEKAKEFYKQLLEKYPGSLYVVEARKRYRALRGDIIN